MTTSNGQATSEWCIARSISYLANYLPESFRTRILERVRHIGDDSARVAALVSISKAFPEQQAIRIRDEAFAAARKVENPWLRSRVLTGIALRAPEHSSQALTEALLAVDQTRNDFHRARALSGMAGILPSNLIDQAIALAQSIADDSSRIACLAFLACYLSESERHLVLDDLPAISDHFVRASALLALAEHLPAQSMDHVLESARGLIEPAAQAQALASLAPNFPDERRKMEQEALEAVQRITNPYDRTEILSELASSLPESELSVLIHDETIAARASGDTLFRTFALKALAQCLSADDRPALITEAIRYAHAVDDNHQRGEVLASLVSDLPEGDRADLTLEIVTLLGLIDESELHDERSY